MSPCSKLIFLAYPMLLQEDVLPEEPELSDPKNTLLLGIYESYLLR